MDSVVIDARFQHPFSMICAGPSFSGKSTYVRNLLIHANRLINTHIDYVVIFSGSNDKSLKNIDTSFKITFVEGLPENLDDFIQPNMHGIFILDDLESKASASQDILDIFTSKCHHENVSIVLVLQNLYNKGSRRIGFLRNCHYLVLFQSPLDQTVNYIVASRLHPMKRKAVVNLIFTVLERYRYILLDGRQDTNPAARFRTDIFNPLYQRCFVLK
jgi:ABC-type iron transport system FetAB ATPase subunit